MDESFADKFNGKDATALDVLNIERSNGKSPYPLIFPFFPSSNERGGWWNISTILNFVSHVSILGNACMKKERVICIYKLQLLKFVFLALRIRSNKQNLNQKKRHGY